MKIIIAGMGDVGSHLAKMLSSASHEIIVIDQSVKVLESIETLGDIVTIEGDCTTFATLKKASARKADLFIAVTHDENANILGAVLAKQLGARRVISRIDNSEYLESSNKNIFSKMGIDFMFYPERVAAREVITLLGNNETADYVDFSGGRLALVVFQLSASSVFAGLPVEEARPPGNTAFRTVAITRNGETIIPHGGDKYLEGDFVYIITDRNSVKAVMSLSDKAAVEIKNLMILGGSRIGIHVARMLQDEMNVKLIEYNADKAYKLAAILDSTLIINEDGRDMEAMLEEGLANMDAFVAVTGRSETNILAAMMAKRLGVKKVIAEVENMNYITLAESIGIDSIVNKKLITASNIYSFTMNTDVQTMRYLTGTDAEVMEFIVKPNSPATKSQLKDLGFPPEAIIGGIVRGENAYIADGNLQIEASDRVVVFTLHSAVEKVSKFFNA